MTQILPPDESSPARRTLSDTTFSAINERVTQDLRNRLAFEIAQFDISQPMSFVNWALELKPGTITTFEQLDVVQLSECLEKIVNAVDAMALKGAWLGMPIYGSDEQQGAAWIK
jgi:hypothetical protein